MELPNVEDLLPSEASATIQFHPNDDNPNIYGSYWSKDMRFDDILTFTRRLKPSFRGKVDKSNTHKSSGPITYSNWHEDWHGYKEWAVPIDSDEDDGNDEKVFRKVRHVMTTQFLYGMSPDGPRYKPEVQLKRMFAAPIERALKSYEQTDEFRSLGNKLYILLIELFSVHTSPKEDYDDRVHDKSAPRVWRLITCYGDTNLDALHDQFIGPAMGWRRHYHAYEFVVPTSGATFGPLKHDGIDMTQVPVRRSYFLDSQSYDLRHVLREPNQRLIYAYDLGDFWKHEITLVAIADRSETIDADTVFQKYPHVLNYFKNNKGTEHDWTLENGMLLGGEINCPPEDSNGCIGMGKYYSLLAKGKSYYVRGDLGINWQEHGIRRAYDFDLKSHQRRLSEALKKKKNPQMGTIQQSLFGTTDHRISRYENERNRHVKISHGNQVEITGKKKLTSSFCANCGKIKSTNSTLVLQKCSRCKSISYCSKECQVQHWKRGGHKQECQPLEEEVPACANCGQKEDTKIHLKTCTACHKVRYCDRECQRQHWKAGHKDVCCKSNTR